MKVLVIILGLAIIYLPQLLLLYYGVRLCCKKKEDGMVELELLKTSVNCLPLNVTVGTILRFRDERLNCPHCQKTRHTEFVQHALIQYISCTVCDTVLLKSVGTDRRYYLLDTPYKRRSGDA